MRTIHIRSLSLAAAAMLTLAGNTAAQDKGSGVLNRLEVRRLVGRAEPRDHVRLSVHFAALGDRYAAEAKRHTSMAQGVIGNPSRNLGTGMSAHCKQAASLNTQLATAVRELAAYHQKLGSGSPATPPPDAAGFQRGAGAPEPTQKELNALAAEAMTPADHSVLEEHFLGLARRYATESKEHAATAAFMRGPTRAPAAASIAAHHDWLAKRSSAAANEAVGAAAMHKEAAERGR